MAGGRTVHVSQQQICLLTVCEKVCSAAKGKLADGPAGLGGASCGATLTVSACNSLSQHTSQRYAAAAARLYTCH